MTFSKVAQSIGASATLKLNAKAAQLRAEGAPPAGVKRLKLRNVEATLRIDDSKRHDILDDRSVSQHPSVDVGGKRSAYAQAIRARLFLSDKLSKVLSKSRARC